MRPLKAASTVSARAAPFRKIRGSLNLFGICEEAQHRVQLAVCVSTNLIAADAMPGSDFAMLVIRNVFGWGSTRISFTSDSCWT